MKRFSFRRLVLLILVVVPLLAWIFVKPVRIIAPTLMDVSCRGTPICVENESRRAEATQLYDEARAFLATQITPLRGTPRMIFCSSDECARSFGLGLRSALTLGTSGTVIGPKAWQPHYVRHELIHHLQAQQLGLLRLLLLTPSWWIEGMAYSLSEDPREVLAEPWQKDRTQFDAWYRTIKKSRLWQQAREL